MFDRYLNECQFAISRISFAIAIFYVSGIHSWKKSWQAASQISLLRLKNILIIWNRHCFGRIFHIMKII